MSQSHEDRSSISDGFHTFAELYEHRHALFIALALAHPSSAWRSSRHEDMSMFDGYFIAGIHLSTGDISYHLPNRLWGYLDGIETLAQAPEWDGHTSADVVNRLLDWVKAHQTNTGAKS